MLPIAIALPLRRINHFETIACLNIPPPDAWPIPPNKLRTKKYCNWLSIWDSNTRLKAYTLPPKTIKILGHFSVSARRPKIGARAPIKSCLAAKAPKNVALVQPKSSVIGMANTLRAQRVGPADAIPAANIDSTISQP